MIRDDILAFVKNSGGAVNGIKIYEKLMPGERLDTFSGLLIAKNISNLIEDGILTMDDEAVVRLVV